MKECNSCKQYKPYSEFRKVKNDYDGRSGTCKVCCKRKESNMRKLDGGESHLRRTYGIDKQEIERIYTEQSGQCACCGENYPGWGKNGLVVDHDHRTGVVRGLLCRTCNVMLGMAKDDPTTLMKGAVYLEKRKAPSTEPIPTKL